MRAFPPRRCGGAGERVAAWRREAPYRAVKRLSDLFREHADTPFSTAAWRQAARRAGNRAKLLLCRDLTIAVAVLRREALWPELYPSGATREDAEADVRDLLTFWQSPLAAALHDKLHPLK